MIKFILSIVSVVLFSTSSFATIGMYCTAGDGAMATTMNIPQLPMVEENIYWTVANELMFQGEYVKEYQNVLEDDVNVKVVESWCDWNLLSEPKSCMMWVKMDFNNNGKFEAEFEVKGVVPASENPDEETVYEGILIDYITTPGKKIKTTATCVISA